MNQHSAFTVRAADLNDPAEAARLDAFVMDHPDAQLFHRPQWSLAVERGCGQAAHYLVAEGGQGALSGILPLTEIRSRLFGNAMVSVGFGVGGGIVASNGRAASALAEAAWSLAQSRGCSSVELRGGEMLDDRWQPRDGVYAQFVRDLPAGDEAILASIKRKQRAEIRRSQGFDLSTEIGRGRDALVDHYRVYSESVRNLGTPVFPRRLFAEMLDRFGEEADILTVRQDGRPIASVLSFYFKDTVYPYWGGGTAGSREWRGHEALYYQLMCHASRRGCTRFDFGRSKLGTGAYAFKKNWGFEPAPLVYSVRTADGAAPRQINPLAPKYRMKTAMWQRLPLWLANRLGPPIARGLG